MNINFTDICSLSDCDEKLVSEKHVYHSKVLNVIWASSQDLFTSGPDGQLVSVSLIGLIHLKIHYLWKIWRKILPQDECTLLFKWDKLLATVFKIHTSIVQYSD